MSTSGKQCIEERCIKQSQVNKSRKRGRTSDCDNADENTNQAKKMKLDLPSDPNKTRKCGACNAENARFKCGGCKQVSYCNRKCQRTDWILHKTACKFQLCKTTIHKKLDETHSMEYNRKSEKIKMTTHESRKSMLDVLLSWHDQDKDKGLNFDEYCDLMQTISSSVSNKNVIPNNQWDKWCKLCTKFGFSDPKTAIIRKEEIWNILYEIASRRVASKNESTKEIFENTEHTEEIYTTTFELLTIVFHELKDLLVKPFTKQEISDAIVAVTPIIMDVAWIVSEYLSEVDAIFKIGSDRDRILKIEWCHDSANTKPLKYILEKYQKRYLEKHGENVDEINQKPYTYHVTFLQEITDTYDESGELAGQHNLFEISIRIKDEFEIVENRRKKYTFVLGTCHAAKLSILCKLMDHVELIGCVLKHHGLDPANVESMYVGKKIYRDLETGLEMRKLQELLVKEFSKKYGAKIIWVDEMFAKFMGIFSEDAYNIKRPEANQTEQNDNGNFNFLANLFAGLI